MFYKLAAKNVRRSFRDYGVYLLTLTFGVCLFYTFNSLDGQGVLLYLGNLQNTMVSLIMTIMDIFSVFVTVVLACLILYANHFLMRRRNRELGTYLLLGLDQGQVSRLLFLETGLIGIISLALGLLLGFFASQALSLLTLSMFEINVSQFQITFSLAAAEKTILYFALIFLVVMVFSGIQVSRAKLLDLLQGERKNEELKQQPLNRSVFQLLIGVVLLLAAYGILLFFGMAISIAVLPLCAAMLSLGTLGTLLIFRSLSGFLLHAAQRHPGFYFKGLNLFTLRQWLSRVRSTYLSMTVICILLLLAIGITACSVGLNSAISSAAAEDMVCDITIQDFNETHAAPGGIAASLRQAGFEPDQLCSGFVDFLLYENDSKLTGFDGAEAGRAIRWSDYRAALALLGRSPSELALDTPILRDDPLGNNVYLSSYVVVPDELAEHLTVRKEIFSANYGDNPEGAEFILLDAYSQFPSTHEDDGSYAYSSRLEEYASLLGNKVLVLFLGLYLGFTFLLAAAAVLALQQLSQAADNTKRYRILRRLGVEEGMLNQSATQQVALAFLFPLLLALIHAAVGMTAANDLIRLTGKIDTVYSSTVTAVALLAIYGGYFLATALACRRMAQRG